MTPLLSSALLATQTDARLLALASAGHERAFEAIVERYRRPLGRYLRRVLSAPLAEDVLQATFVNAWRSLERGTDVRDLRPWLYRIAHNQAVNALSRAEPSVAADADATSELVAITPGPEAEAEQRDTLQRALTAIAGLPDRQRAALVAVAVEDRPHPDVARELGLTEGALRQLIHRARTTLRAAATAVVPVPLVTAAVSGGGDTPLARVAELAAGAGGAGLGVKTGAALLAAGAMVVGAPAVHEQRLHPGVARVAAAHAAPAPRVVRTAPAHLRAAVQAFAPPRRVAARPVAHAAVPVRRARPHPVPSAPTSDGRGGRDDHESSSDAPPRVSTSRGDDGGHSGRTDPTGEAVAEPSRSGESSSGTGSGSGEPTEAAPAPVDAVTTATGDNSGHGSSDDVPSLP